MISPLATRRRVVLPAPLRPAMAAVVPGSSVRSALATTGALCEGQLLVTPRRTSGAWPGALSLRSGAATAASGAVTLQGAPVTAILDHSPGAVGKPQPARTG